MKTALKNFKIRAIALSTGSVTRSYMEEGLAQGIQMVMQEVYRTTSSILNVTSFQDVHDRMRNTNQESMYFI